MGADTECTYTMAASFVCTYIVDRKPQPPDYVVKSAHAIVEATPNLPA